MSRSLARAETLAISVHEPTDVSGAVSAAAPCCEPGCGAGINRRQQNEPIIALKWRGLKLLKSLYLMNYQAPCNNVYPFADPYCMSRTSYLWTSLSGLLML